MKYILLLKDEKLYHTTSSEFAARAIDNGYKEVAIISGMNISLQQTKLLPKEITGRKKPSYL